MTPVKPFCPAMHPHEALVREFYAAFAAHDAERMARCYHPDVFFTDAVFQRLHGEEAADMWRMLLARARGLEVSLERVSAGPDGAQAHWTARYAFGPRARPVTNRVRALFAFRDGLICRHYDSFSFWRWAAQALGPAGRLFGWFAPFKWAVRRNAMRSLERFRAARG